MLDLREVADEWEADLDGGEGYIPDANDVQKYVDLCTELGISPVEPATLRWYAERNGATLIPDDLFEDYARSFAEDIGAIDSDTTWPCDCIDWEKAANQLRMDFTAIEYDGETYWRR